MLLDERRAVVAFGHDPREHPMEEESAQTIAWLDQEDERTAQIIRKHGVFIQYVSGDIAKSRPSFAYTTGLFGIGHPELLVFHVPTAVASGLLNDVAGRVRAGRDLVPGEVLEFDEWAHRVTVEEVPNPAEIVFAANRFADRPDELSVPVYQLTYDDLNGRFPWESGYLNPEWYQPRPGTFRA
ncbi:DUF4262 domain-containing protein [Rathayibacter sp. YIM 133350]|uniref:DUF4262 domain-containing protein n=1 Tax=Rathayibacter sp. YIM 133350 TaxID=3131992 RepID=UPI00307DB87C